MAFWLFEGLKFTGNKGLQGLFFTIISRKGTFYKHTAALQNF